MPRRRAIPHARTFGLPSSSTTASSASATRANVAEFSVSELATAIRRTLEGGYGHVRLRGEISGYRGPHSSGHCYFALKDDAAKIEAVVWRGVFSGLRFKPEEGMEVIATGKVTTYPGSSKYQLVIEALEPAGAGALMAVLEERKRMLAAEGLFEASRKRKLPFLPRVIGIVTSPTGAVIRDMLHGFDERFPAHVIVWPVRVQGPTSAPEVAAAIRGFNALVAGGPVPRPDVLIIARGGGSLEDLWGFNEEAVVRAAAESAIPLISAVGHETDWTLLDLVADARAPTPTKAAEWAVPKYSDLVLQLGDYALRLTAGLKRTLESERVRLRAAARGLPRAQDLLALPRQHFDSIAVRLPRALVGNTQRHSSRFGRVGARLGPQVLQSRLHRARDRLNTLTGYAQRAFATRIERQRARLFRVADRLQPRLILVKRAQSGTRLTELSERARRAAERTLEMRRRRLHGQAQVLATLSYRSTLERGFAIVRDHTGKMVRSRAGIEPGDRLEVELVDGRMPVVASSPPSKDASGGPALQVPSGRVKTASVKPGQGSLF
jgi:exodeoxyribonuclease VII large subunit